MTCRPRQRLSSTRALKGAVLMLSCSMFAACAGQNVRPVAQISSRPLDVAVDSETVFQLVSFAAKDRTCAAREQHALQPERRATDDSEWQPIAATGHEPYAAYIDCMYTEHVTACDAVEQDLRTVRTLLDRDPRLSAIVSFDALLVRLRQQCFAPGQGKAFARSPRSLGHRALRRCDDQYQPVLVTTAVLLSALPPRDEEAFSLWSAECRGTAGYFFMDAHCASLRRQRSGAPVVAGPEQGVEAYFCPQIKKHFSS